MGEQLQALQRAFADRAKEAVENGAGWFDTAFESASRATDALWSKVQAVSGAVQDNPEGLCRQRHA